MTFSKPVSDIQLLEFLEQVFLNGFGQIVEFRTQISGIGNSLGILFNTKDLKWLKLSQRYNNGMGMLWKMQILVQRTGP
ncbi:hypothetical protein CDAR_55011 [Caerostris darwini]|uniref:Uncharacterized protein n=1 Tax=Caerostris darwini TaxID=1538125 RepID=A0AAV4PF39_9ARAC|nr:hypothetical protein CDAR_55011 [Caerostris darwini]